ncbi:unnamed protein product, partial [Hapterophycus canaliculatus]
LSKPKTIQATIGYIEGQWAEMAEPEEEEVELTSTNPFGVAGESFVQGRLANRQTLTTEKSPALATEDTDAPNNKTVGIVTDKPSKKPPIEIRIDPEGNLVISSEDTRALDQLENLMLEIKPPQRPYRVFKVENASVTLLTFDLEDYFADEDEEEDSDADNFYSWYWGNDDDDDDKGPTGLAKTGKLRFLANSDTNTIVVTGASSEQLRTIEELI